MGDLFSGVLAWPWRFREASSVQIYVRILFSSPVDILTREMLTSLIALLATVSTAVALWPMPRALTTEQTPLKLSDTFSILLNIQKPPNDLVAATSTVHTQLRNDTFQRLVIGRATTDAAAIAHAPTLQSLAVSLTQHAAVRPIAVEAVEPFEFRSESYQLTVPHDGSQATLLANSTLGLFRGLTTFAQLWYSSNTGKYILDAPVNIVDVPAFVRFIPNHCCAVQT